ncbi:MAG: TIM barrel protein [Candidatus Eremiobacteraeota bacterium]|nr:TIM barrel protein [Candidatus Eremiobacteraeota bacterium]MBV8366761.1 TIM barrel protein [Candidatus Eremiobacteraeota bacterium]
MRLALSSRSFARALESGTLTQLEWIDVCCAEPAIDGADFAREHFPRRDDDYLAQIKKLCVDRRLTIAGMNSAARFGGGGVDAQAGEMCATLDEAALIGAPLVRFSCAAVDGPAGVVWGELIRGLKFVSEHAKRVNVTLALAPLSGTLVADEAAAKRALKECDSAWLRLAIPAAVAWETHARDAVVMTSAPRGDDLAAALRFRGFVSLEDESGTLDAARLRRWAETFYAPGIE